MTQETRPRSLQLFKYNAPDNSNLRTRSRLRTLNSRAVKASRPTLRSRERKRSRWSAWQLQRSTCATRQPMTSTQRSRRWSQTSRPSFKALRNASLVWISTWVLRALAVSQTTITTSTVCGRHEMAGNANIRAVEASTAIEPEAMVAFKSACATSPSCRWASIAWPMATSSTCMRMATRRVTTLTTISQSKSRWSDI